LRRGYTRALAAYVAETEFDDLPKEAIARVKLHFLDALGISLGACGTGHRRIRKLIELAEAQGKGEATILGAGKKASALDTAMVNAVMANFLDFSDGHFMGGHINDRLVPLTLAIAERVGASGKEFLTALALGYEVYIELAYTLFAKAEPASAKLPYFVMLGPLAGAAAAGKLLGLDRDQLAGALGLAASIQIGGAQYVLSGGHEKDLSPGHEARRALLSVLIAGKGILGSQDILEGERGIGRALDAEANFAAQSSRGYRIKECYIKPYPACRYLHASIEATLNLVREQKIEITEIEKVVVSTNSSSARRISYEIKSHVNAIFSHAYQVAAVLWDGRVDLPTAWEEKIRDPLFNKLLHKIEVRATPEYDRLHQQKSLDQPPWPAEVEVLMRDGRQYRSQVLSPKGDPTNPLTPAEVQQKFINLTGKLLPNRRRVEVLELVDQLETLPSLRKLIELLVVR